MGELKVFTGNLDGKRYGLLAARTKKRAPESEASQKKKDNPDER